MSTDVRMFRRFGRVSARPSEYLIQLRRGKIVRHGPGLSVFLWPGDTCTLLPTSIQRTTFVADQITAERIGVAVKGLAVYRIAEPLLAFRLLDFSRGPAALADLSETLREMFVGAARRLVANLTVEDCMTRRKEGIAAELLREIQPVVGGHGRPEDTTDRGWGIVLDTLEIQEVRVLSEKVFADMQAPYRSALESRARQAALARDEEVALREAGAQRAGDEARRGVAREAALADERDRLEALARRERLREAERAAAEREAAAALAIALDQLARDGQRAEAEHSRALLATEQAAALERRRIAEDAALTQARAEADAALRMSDAMAQQAAAVVVRETERAAAEQALELRAKTQALADAIPEARTRHSLVTEVLPALAQAIAQTIGPVHIQEFGAQSGRGAGFLSGLVAECLGLARSFGVPFPGQVPALSDAGRAAAPPAPAAE